MNPEIPEVLGMSIEGIRIQAGMEWSGQANPDANNIGMDVHNTSCMAVSRRRIQWLSKQAS